MELIKENIKLVRNKLFSSNTYFLMSDLDDSCIVIDPGLDCDAIISCIRELKIKPIAVLSTHGHFDHIGAAAIIQKEFNAPFYLHEEDFKMSQSANFFLRLAKIELTIITPKPDFIIKGKEGKIEVGNFKIEYYNYPGHSNGSCIFKYGNCLFTGDIFYKKGIYPESVPKEDKKLLKESILAIFSKFTSECLVLPGHGGSDLLGNIKQHNLELQEFISN